MLWVQPSPRYLEDGVQVSQRGPALPGVAHPLAVGVVLVGWHHIHRVVAKGPAAEGAAGQVGGLDAVTAGPLGGWVGTPAPLLHAQEGADGEAATAVGWGQIWDGQLGHCPCPGAGQVGTGWRGACQLYTLHNRSEVTGTHPPLMLIEERNQLEPPQAGQGEKNSWKGYQNHHNGHHCLPALDGGSDNRFEIKSQGQISREMQR